MAKTYTQQFNSIDQFYKYICDTPFNEAFRWARHGSVDNDRWFCGTSTFEQAVDLLRNGWSDKAVTLTQKLNTAIKQTAPITKQRNVNGVCGYQPIVPLYLAGVPTNMVSKQMVKVKSKVINITKSLNYSSRVDKQQIEEESIKALQIVHKLERQGYRVNLHIALGTHADNKDILCRIKIKDAGEKLNISKLAFPLVHPSMLRRLYFRYIEVCPDVTDGYARGYGYPVETSDMREAYPNDIVIPAILAQEAESITNLDMLEAVTYHKTKK